MYCYSNCIVRYSIPEFNDGISLIRYMYVLQTIIYIRGFEVFYLLIGKNNRFVFYARSPIQVSGTYPVFIYIVNSRKNAIINISII